ncbi:trehalose-phosphatase [Ensifer sp. NM-2]|jgi:trehalose 6-phosphate phosphatase|uniref:trehalose-phosphatase n=1 Tax=unclassified Ensifer TaxID=2633371 RepID=UPI0009EBE097|nr:MULTISPECIES: trehalose-phosphatase [unclassified Ensifer]PSS64374.1 trehalose-phosphatase [Ensifer sp. NM-2]
MTTDDSKLPFARKTPALDTALRDLVENPLAWALFLDIDGTLLDLAPTPDAIHVPAELPENLHHLSTRMDGALAIVTGRALLYADELFQPFEFPIAGLHGGEMRGTDGHLLLVEAPTAFAILKGNLLAEAQNMPDVLVEDKGAAVALHYRLAPSFEQEVEALMRRYAEKAGPDWTLQMGKKVCELRPAGASKADALERFMANPPFRGRRPLAIGDDLTDETMFATANAMGGYSIRIGRPSAVSCALGTIQSPQDLRDYLAFAMENS